MFFELNIVSDRSYSLTPSFLSPDKNIFGRLDIHYNDTQLNNKTPTLSITILSNVVLSVVYAECRNAEFRGTIECLAKEPF